MPWEQPKKRQKDKKKKKKTRLCIFFKSLRLQLFYILLFVSFFSLLLMEVPRLGVELELQLPAYTTATATLDLSRIGGLHHSSRQCRIPNPLSKTRDRTCSLVDPSWIRFCCTTAGTLRTAGLLESWEICKPRADSHRQGWGQSPGPWWISPASPVGAGVCPFWSLRAFTPSWILIFATLTFKRLCRRPFPRTVMVNRLCPPGQTAVPSDSSDTNQVPREGVCRGSHVCPG